MPRRLLLLRALGAVFLLVSIVVHGDVATRSGHPLKRPTVAAVPGELLVAFKPNRSVRSLTAQSAQLIASSKMLARTRSGIQIARVKVHSNTRLEHAAGVYGDDPAVVAVSPNYLRYTQAVTNDTYFDRQWGLHNIGQTIGTPVYLTNNPGLPDADVDGPEAWDSVTGSSSVVVAVIDSGVDYTHPDLANAMWDATGATTPSNFHGWDFADDDDDPYPVGSEHGTHVAGIVAATGNNALGVAGIAHGVKIMALKVFPDRGGGAADSDIIAAIQYAAANGADVINLSLGGGGPENPVMTLAMADAIASGVLIVAAAGNDGANNDNNPSWPANNADVDSTRDGVVSVLASDQADQRASFSNFGRRSVTVAAPGTNILSTVTGREVRQSETLTGIAPGVWTHCSLDPTTCMDNSIFDAGGAANDCAAGASGTTCRWGLYKDASNPSFAAIYGDNDTPAGYAGNIDGTIQTAAIDVSGADRVVLRYLAVWDLECGNDYVDVEVWDGAAWQLLSASEFNINNTVTNFCVSQHTHTGRTLQVFGPLEIAHDITQYAQGNTALAVRFRFVTNASGSFDLEGGFLMADVAIDVQASDYSTSYAFFNGTSMASPLVAGVAALVKSRFPAYGPIELKRAVVNSGDTIAGLSTLTSSGRRVNALRAVSAPTIAALSPTSIAAGSNDLTLTVDGANFEAGASVRWNGVDQPTTFVSSTRLTAVVPSTLLWQRGGMSVTVFNPIVSLESNAQILTIKSRELAGRSGCFIATAAYGSPMASEVRYLRAFRDRYLLRGGVGRWLVEQYYRFSPPLAERLREHERWRAAVRAMLTPLVTISRWLVEEQDADGADAAVSIPSTP